jgi:hypothetical protein
MEGTRRNIFESLEKPALRPLPALRYQFAQWKKAKVNIDYHVKSILTKGLDQQVLNENIPATPIKHDNIRGPEYYGKPKGGTYLC